MKVSVLGIVIILSIILVIIFGVYYIIYKKKINKSLQLNESTAHISMTPAESVGKILVIIGAVLVAISIISQLSGIASDVQQTYCQLRTEIQNLRCEVSDLQDQIEKQNSPLNSFEYSFGKVNSNDNTVETTFRCVPKSIPEDTVITITLGEQVITLEAAGNGVFTATKQLPLFAEIGTEATVAITAGGITNTSIINDAPCDSLCTQCLPRLGDYLESLTDEWENGKLTFSGTYTPEKGDGMSDIKLFFVIDDSVVKTLDNEGQVININETFELSNNSIIKLVAEGTDQYGYTHKKVLYAFSANITADYGYLDSDTIIDKDGNVLYGVL
ncbi:MAG: hypothetical protein MR364_00440 [Oscillospiraceae bacterium]|nr:hypothetical protein [Oscillospiraceae bacterium]